MNKGSPEAVPVLVVEDDPGDFGLIRAQMLAEGIAAARRDRPDIALLDLSLPDSAGLETVRAMRAALHDAPIVVLTGCDDNALDSAAIEAGARPMTTYLLYLPAAGRERNHERQ